jgi:hypothetical protein
MRGKKMATALEEPPDPPKSRRERKLRHATRVTKPKPVRMKEGRPLDERALLDS